MKENYEKKDPSVAIIIVNYNGTPDTLECVKSLKKISYQNYKIIVVDNGSSKKPEGKDKEFLLEHTVYIESEENLGFSGGNNIGIKWAMQENYKYVLLINNDTTVEENFVDVLVSAAEKQENVGIVGGKILFYSKPDTIWFGGGKLDYKYGGGSHERWNQKNTKDTSEIREVSFLTGCLMLIPMDVIRKTGYLDESYFLYVEDTEFCNRVARCGYSLYFCENSLIYHKVSASTGACSPMSQYYMLRNVLFLTREYFPNYRIIHFRLLFKTLKDILRGRKEILPNIMALCDYLRGKTGKM